MNINMSVFLLCVAMFVLGNRVMCALNDKYDSRIDYCKHHMSAFVDEQQHFESLLAKHGHKSPPPANEVSY